MRRSVETSALSPRIQTARGAAMPTFCSAISTIVRGIPLRAIKRPIASRSLSSSAVPMKARTATCTTVPSIPSLTISYRRTKPCACVST